MKVIVKMLPAVLASTFVFGAALAQPPAPTAGPHASADSSGSATAMSDAKRDSAVETHIKELHGTLKITPAEESQWNDVAATMRENAKALDRAIDKRAASAASATAIDDLKAYAEIAQVHANGVKKLESSFAALYAAMSDDQKKEADEVFSHRREAGKIAKQ